MPQEGVSLSVLVPVYNERHLVKASIGRLLSLSSDLISRLEIIIIDDRSTDGSWEILQEMVSLHPKIKLFRHEKNMGKGAAIKTALFHATGDVSIVHDADMEYNPADIPLLLRPFLEEGADAVFGSRYLSATYRRVLMYRHSLINKTLTTIINWFTDLDLSDVETCYKAIKTRLFKSIPLRCNDFRFEVEITMKLARRRVRVFEVPIRYLPRSYEEGKKIRFSDGILALLATIRFSLIEDIYQGRADGLKNLLSMSSARRFNQWMANTMRPYIGERVLEISSGMGMLTNQFIPRELYVASDINYHALEYLRSYAIGKPYLKVAKIDANKAQDFESWKGAFDTALAINVLEHLPNEDVGLKNILDVLSPGGKVIVLVPNYPRLGGPSDETLGYRERYSKAELKAILERTGFQVETLFDFNRFNVPSWILNALIFKRKRFSLIQLKVLEILMPLIRRIDRFLPWEGLSLIGVGVKK